MPLLPSLCDNLPTRLFQPGEILLREGEPSACMFVLQSGRVEILKGEMQLAAVDTPGSVFGEISALLRKTPMATVRAAEPTLCSVVEDPARILNEHPEMALHIATILARRLSAITDYLQEARQALPQAREAALDEVFDSFAKRVFGLPRRS
jgi:CRP-like cAMP-binding protein